MDKTLLKLQEKAKTLPQKAGCYLMKRSNGQIIYVGKAKSLKSRVSSYFNKGAKSPKTEILVSHIRDFDFLITETEAEALVLENNLIKKHSPKYNIRLKDDRSYPYVVVNKKEDFPRLTYTRRVKRSSDKEVFGPFVVGSNISEVIRIITKSFSLRDCSLREFQSRKEPCLLYQMHQCTAPCVDKISKEKYLEDLNTALDFFRGEGKKSLKILEKRMLFHAEKEEFERAAIIRDHIGALEKFSEYSKQQNVELEDDHRNVDVVAFFAGELEVEIAIYMVRNGLLLGHKMFHFPLIECEEEIDEEVLNYLFQYYTTTHDSLPELLILPFSKDRMSLFSNAIKQSIEEKIKVQTPRKQFKSLMKLTEDHARESQRVRLSNLDSVYVGLNKLKELLSLKERPIVMECFDVAIWQGASPTASQVVFHDGKPDKKNYRHYKLEERPEGNNDFAMMKEMLKRRIPHGELPDVFVVDGGIGQVNMLREVLKDFEIDLPVVGIAKSRADKSRQAFKKKNVSRSEERLIIPGRSNPYYLTKNPSLFRILTQMRDEAHRFSRRLHHKHEKKRIFHSWLDDIEGVGPATRKKIQARLDLPINELSKMNQESLIETLGVSEKIAERIFAYLKSANDND